MIHKYKLLGLLLMNTWQLKMINELSFSLGEASDRYLAEMTGCIQSLIIYNGQQFTGPMF